MDDSSQTIDTSERTKGFGSKPGESLDRRLFMQLLVFQAERGSSAATAERALIDRLRESKTAAVVYADVCNPRGFGLLSWSDDPAHFVEKVRPLFDQPALAGLELLPKFTMFGRSYATGYEPDLAHWLLTRPVDTACNERWPWAVWYPLRRRSGFDRMDDRERGSILREHAEIGRAYGAADLAHDIRLACHALDANDNEFVIGLVSKTLHPLSHIVQRMRKTQQTAEHIVQMGPFFVGQVRARVTPDR
jgi:hypothetical protein